MCSASGAPSSSSPPGSPDTRVREELPEGALVVAADGGVDAALALGLTVAVAVGDFDSVTPDGLATVEGAGGRVERHPRAKDATDLELALDTAVDLGAERIVVVGDSGGRLDHLLAGLLVLGHGRYAHVEIDAMLGAARAHVVRTERVLQGEPGELVSLLPLGGAADGVVTEGLEYPLHEETLEAGTSRGVSNVFTAHRARIVVGRGALAALRPGTTERRPS